jgi:hypothetical protein
MWLSRIPELAASAQTERRTEELEKRMKEDNQKILKQMVCLPLHSILPGILQKYGRRPS